MELQNDSIVIMKKQHPCHKSNELQILRLGIDVKTRCMGCKSIVIIPRLNFEKKLKEIKYEK